MPLRDGLPGLDSSIPFSPDPLSHVFLVIHGAGDPYIDHQPWLSSLETCVNLLDKNYRAVATDLSKTLRRADIPSAMFLPVEWHASAHHTWRAAVAKGDPRPMPRGAPPSVRDAVAETVGDVLLLASPFWRAEVARHVATQMAEQLAAVRRNRPAFRGRVSVIAHSVGALVALEVLHRGLLQTAVDAVVLTGCPAAAYAALAPDAGDGVGMGALHTIRRDRGHVRFINVFHPLDPVAYRLEPFVNNEGDEVLPAVKVGPRKRSFWDDAEMFWDDVVFNLWSTLFPERGDNGQIGPSRGSLGEENGGPGGDEDENEDDNDVDNDDGKDDGGTNTTAEEGQDRPRDRTDVVDDGRDRVVGDLFSRFGGNERGKTSVRDKGRREMARGKVAGRLRRSASYVVPQSGDEGEQRDDADAARGGSEVLLSGRIDYELQDGMGVPPLDVMASWGAIKAHTYYWQSLDVAQMLLDIAVTSDHAMASR